MSDRQETHWDIAEVGAVCHPECAITQLAGAAADCRRQSAALTASRERCKALEGALRELVEAGGEIEAHAMDESSRAYIDARTRYIAAFKACAALTPPAKEPT